MELPEGLEIHCEHCQLVIPSDLPRLDGAECASVAQAKLSHFYPEETPAAQHSMATATWSLIHRESFWGEQAKQEHVELNGILFLNRRKVFGTSAVRNALTVDQVEAGRSHRRDGWLYEDGV